MPIEQVDVTLLKPPPDLLRQIDAMAKAIETLIDGGAFDAAKAVAAELRAKLGRETENAASS